MFQNNNSLELIVYWKCKEYSVLLILYFDITKLQSNKIIMIVLNSHNLIETKSINMDYNFVWTQLS